MLSNTKPLYCIVIFLLLLGCSANEESVPLPKSYLRIDFPQKSFHSLNSKCPFSFEIPDYCFSAEKFTKLPPCYKTLIFPDFKAELLCSYKKIDSSVFTLIEQIRSNVDAHNFRAQGVIENTWLNPEKNVYGNTFEITGNVACNYIFYLTDSTNHFFSAELLFMAKPNYDSLQPVIRFIEYDLRRLVQTFQWEKEIQEIN